MDSARRSQAILTPGIERIPVVFFKVCPRTPWMRATLHWNICWYSIGVSWRALFCCIMSFLFAPRWLSQTPVDHCIVSYCVRSDYSLVLMRLFILVLNSVCHTSVNKCEQNVVVFFRLQNFMREGAHKPFLKVYWRLKKSYLTIFD